MFALHNIMKRLFDQERDIKTKYLAQGTHRKEKKRKEKKKQPKYFSVIT